MPSRLVVCIICFAIVFDGFLASALTAERGGGEKCPSFRIRSHLKSASHKPLHPLFADYDDVGIEDFAPRESDGGGGGLTGGAVALAVVLFLVLVATGAFLIWAFVEQKFCFGRKNAQDYSAIRLRQQQRPPSARRSGRVQVRFATCGTGLL